MMLPNGRIYSAQVRHTKIVAKGGSLILLLFAACVGLSGKCILPSAAKYIYIYICMYVCMYVYVCMHLCMYVCIDSSIHVSIYQFFFLPAQAITKLAGGGDTVVCPQTGDRCSLTSIRRVFVM